MLSYGESTEGENEMEKALYFICLIAITAVSVGFALTGHGNNSARIEKLENRIAELECRHVRFEDGSTIHADAERTAECAYTSPDLTN
jgi:hypothetical protein